MDWFINMLQYFIFTLNLERLTINDLFDRIYGQIFEDKQSDYNPLVCSLQWATSNMMVYVYQTISSKIFIYACISFRSYLVWLRPSDDRNKIRFSILCTAFFALHLIKWWAIIFVLLDNGFKTVNQSFCYLLYIS